jgi:hypothetical protein
MSYNTYEALGDTPFTQSQKTILGVIGSSTAKRWTRETVANSIMNPVLGEFEKLPDTILLAAEGTVSILIHMWSDSHRVQCKVLETDWSRMGRKARAVRDSKILKEATHLLIFLGIRSDYYEKIAMREAKKGRSVFTVSASTGEIVLWEP